VSDPGPAPPKLDEAAAWLVRLRNRAISTRSLREFGDWRMDPANDAAFQEVQAAWTKTGDLAADPDILRATDAALAAPAGGLRSWFTWPRAGWTAAVASLVVTAGAIFGPGLTSPSYATDVGQQLRVRLPDGSRVLLNTDSKVRLAYKAGERRLVLLRGEAFFEVAPDARRPFVVEAGDTAVRALGTRFEVRREVQTVQVTLLEGVVQVRQDDAPKAWTLAPNQQLRITGAGVEAPRATDAAAATSWTTGRLNFQNTPLADAIAEVNRYADQKVELQAVDLSGRAISGAFDVGDTAAFVQGVSSLFELEAVPGPDGAIRLRRPPGATAG
jgi:transmembrane sensor